jgi:alkylglycerol monooxygenase
VTHASAPAPAPVPARRWALDLLFFVGATLAALWAELAPGDVAVALKLVPMGTLIVHLALRLRAGEVARRMAVALLVGLGLSTVGDIVIAYQFLAGIAAFLLAHVAYLVAMGRPRGSAAQNGAAALPALAVGATMGWILVGGGRLPAPMRVPVLVYMIVISAMLARAVARAVVAPRTRASRAFLVGAALFVTSDALIALSRWVVTVPHPHVAILATYFAAQWWISTGAEPAPRDSP